jgi:hypothetical protein
VTQTSSRGRAEGSPTSFAVVSSYPSTRIAASPNTVRACAYGLPAWWTLLEHTGAFWDEFPTSLFGQFLAYLRSGGLPDTARIASTVFH